MVHGAWALAAAIDKKVRVEVSDSDRLTIASDRVRSRDSARLRPLETVVRAMAREYSFSPNVSVSVRSDVRPGTGLGSSASCLVALAAALSALHSLGLGKAELVRLSMEGEREVHGRPSGIDPAVCAYGGVILFRQGRAPTRVAVPGSRSLLLAYSGKQRRTRDLVERVSRFREGNPRLFESLGRSVSEVSRASAGMVSSNDLQGLGRLMNLNQAVLSAVGASDRALDAVAGLLLELGAYGAKLTGAGGGGCVLAVAPEGKEKSIISDLGGRGIESFLTTIPVGGVRSWLA